MLIGNSVACFDCKAAKWYEPLATAYPAVNTRVDIVFGSLDADDLERKVADTKRAANAAFWWSLVAMVINAAAFVLSILKETR